MAECAPPSSTFNAWSDDALSAIERLSVQNSQDLDMGELGTGLGSEALDVQFSRDLLKRCSHSGAVPTDQSVNDLERWTAFRGKIGELR